MVAIRRPVAPADVQALVRLRDCELRELAHHHAAASPAAATAPTRPAWVRIAGTALIAVRIHGFLHFLPRVVALFLVESPRSNQIGLGG